MQIGVPRETAPLERRVALVPASVSRLVQAGLGVAVQAGAGEAAHFPDAAYAEAGAAVVPDAVALWQGSDVVAKVRRPSAEEAALLREGALLVSLMQPGAEGSAVEAVAARGASAFALELVPRISRAQSMDVLSSQATVAGYKAVLVGAAELGKMLPMLTTAAGSITPARVFVIGAGVAGLQAIATARRLGAVVTAFDVRPAAAEQVQSLGATFVGAELLSAAAEDRGGYAKEQDEARQRAILAAVGAHLPEVDLVVTTAQIPGRPAPRLVTREMLAAMRPGSVVVDLAAETGGNCEATVAGESVTAHGVTVLGPLNLPATVPQHASLMFSRNVETFLKHLLKDPSAPVDVEDEITGAMCLVHAGQVRRR